jgi:hypothetical protein
MKSTYTYCPKCGKEIDFISQSTGIYTNDTQAPESHELKASFEPMHKMIIFLKMLKMRLVALFGISFSRDGRLMFINLYFKKWRFKIKKSSFKFLKYHL